MFKLKSLFKRKSKEQKVPKGSASVAVNRKDLSDSSEGIVKKDVRGESIETDRSKPEQSKVSSCVTNEDKDAALDIKPEALQESQPDGVTGLEEDMEEAPEPTELMAESTMVMMDVPDQWVEEEEEEEDETELVPEGVFIEQSELVGYRLINKIGTGAFSKVYRAIPDRNDKQTSFLTKHYKEVAIKVIKKQDLKTMDQEKQTPSNDDDNDDKETKSSSREQVMKEVTIHKSVAPGCEYIVAFIDFKETENYYYIVQELLNGGEIFGEIVRFTYFSEDLSRHVITQLALAIKHLHSMGVVHRDIKPENLLFESTDIFPSSKIKLRKSDDPTTKLDEGEFKIGIGGGGIGKVKLVDFGLSKQIYQTNTQTPCGTVGYTAPEVVKDEKYSMKVDAWGVGCVLYTILCGFPPFYDEKINILTEKIANGEYTFLEPWWDEISDGAKNAVSKLLEVDPNKRYDIDEFLNDPWLNNYDCQKSQTAEQKMLQNQQKLQERNAARKKTRLRNKAWEKDSSLLYSPAAVAMRDAFDITNAVQRIKEDKNNKNADFITKKKNKKSNLQQLTEEAEEDTNSKDNNAYQQPLTTDSTATTSNSHFQQGDTNCIENDMFNLKLDTSTIIKRRRDKS